MQQEQSSSRRQRVYSDNDEWPKLCPGPCGRLTMPRERDRKRRGIALPDNWNGATAQSLDGTCMRCYRLEQTKALGGTTIDSRNRYLPTCRVRRAFDVRKERDAVLALWEDRRRRGVPEDGIDPEKWAMGNGGLYSWEV